MKKIVVIGPESTGKSTLCSQLAAHYQTLWCPEYAREYLEKNGMDYTYDNLLTIARGQLAAEDSMLSVGSWQLSGKSSLDSQLTTHNSPLFIDTDMYVMKVWCEFAFNKCHSWILNQAAIRKYDLYLLCDVDLPWIKDNLREYPDLETRDKLYHFYKDIMINQSTPWARVSGTYGERLQFAIEKVDKLLNCY